MHPSRGSKARRGSSFLLLESLWSKQQELEVRDAQLRPVPISNQRTESRLQKMEVPPVHAQLLQLVLPCAAVGAENRRCTTINDIPRFVVFIRNQSKNLLLAQPLATRQARGEGEPVLPKLLHHATVHHLHRNEEKNASLTIHTPSHQTGDVTTGGLSIRNVRTTNNDARVIMQTRQLPSKPIMLHRLRPRLEITGQRKLGTVRLLPGRI